MSGQVLLDGATLHATGALFQRIGAERAIRPINVLALSALIDAYVLFEKLVVPKANWEYFQAVAPTDWVAFLQDVVEPIDITFDLNGFRSFIANPYVFLALNGIIKADTDTKIYFDYRSYVGGDIGDGIQPGIEQFSEDLQRMESIIQEEWAVDKGPLRWDYLHSNTDHVDPVHAAWRGCQYSAFCAEKGYWYVPHELRGRFIDAHATLLGQHHLDPVAERIMAGIREHYLERKNRPADDIKIPAGLFPKRPQSELLWQQFKMPLVSARVFQQSNTLYGIFEEAGKLRQSAAGFRKACAAIDLIEKSDRLEQASKAYEDITALFKSLDQTIQAPGVNWSLSLSYPWGVSIGLEPDSAKLAYPKHFSFARDIYDCRLLPTTYQSDLIRLFGQDPSDFLRRYG